MNPGSKYARLLQVDPRVNNGTTGGGLAYALQKGLAGYLAGKDTKDKKSARAALLQGMSAKPWVDPDTGKVSSDPAGGLKGGAAALRALGENDYAQDMLFDIMMQQQAAKAADDVRRQDLKDKMTLEEFKSNQRQIEALNNRHTFLSPDRVKALGLPEGTVAQMGPSGKVNVLRQPGLKDPWLSIPGLGAYNVTSGNMITPQNTAQGPAAPAQPVPPIPGMSPKGMEDLNKKRVEKDLDAVGKMREEAQDANAMLGNLRQFERALKTQESQNQGTGGLLRQLPGAGLVEGQFDPEIGEMSSIADRLTPLMRQGMPGAASDRDVMMFRGATVGADKTPEVNRRVSQGLETALRNKIAKAEFMQWHIDTKGSLRGAEEMWKQYLNANPIFDEFSKDQYAMNPDRKDWRDWVSEGGKSREYVYDEATQSIVPK